MTKNMLRQHRVALLEKILTVLTPSVTALTTQESFSPAALDEKNSIFYPWMRGSFLIPC